MAELIQFRSPDYRPTTLDEVWREAESIGRISVEKTIFSGKYRAQIAFDTRHGSCYAKAEHDSALIALGMAINHARQLGAGEPG